MGSIGALLQAITAIVLLLGYASASGSIPTTSDVRFAARRCFGDGKTLDDILEQPGDEQCMTKCFLHRLGLIDVKTRGLNTAMLWRRYAVRYDRHSLLPDDCRKFLHGNRSLDDRCVSYHREMPKLREACPHLFNVTFGMHKDKNSKMKGETALCFCNHYEQTRTFTYCLLRELHFIDGYGRCDESELLLSYKESGFVSPMVANLVTKCVHHANARYGNVDVMAAQLIDCLREDRRFPEVLMHRNSLSGDY